MRGGWQESTPNESVVSGEQSEREGQCVGTTQNFWNGGKDEVYQDRTARRSCETSATNPVAKSPEGSGWTVAGTCGTTPAPKNANQVREDAAEVATGR